MRTIEEQVRLYARYADETLPWVHPSAAISADKVREIRLVPIPKRERPRPWVAFAAAAAVIVIAGGIVVLSINLAMVAPSNPVADLTTITTASITVPSQSGLTWPTSINKPILAPASITDAPLPHGADIAFTSEDAGSNSLVVVSGDQLRFVTTKRALWAVLSPDGRYVAYATVPFEGDRFAVVDLTTGKTIVDEHVTIPRGASDGTEAQTNDLQWSADGRRLIQLIHDTSTFEQTVVRVWEISDEGMVLFASLERLPGNFMAVSPDGSTIAAESEGFVALSSVDHEIWSQTSVAALPPDVTARATDEFPLPTYAKYRWSPDGETISWVESNWAGPRAVQLDVVRLATSSWSSRLIPDAREASLVGWHDTAPILERTSTTGAVQLIRLNADGKAQVLTTLQGVMGASVAQDRVP